MSDEKEPYDPPEVEPISTESGPSVTAAGQTGPSDSGPEWHPTEGER